MKNKLLIVVDMQNDFITGSLGTPEAKAIVPNVKKKIEEYQQNGYEVIFTRDTHFDDYLETKEGQKLSIEHCIKNTWGWEICDKLNEYAHTYQNIEKYTFGYDEWAWFLSSLHSSNYYEIELVGLCTDICVISNALILKSIFFNSTEITVDASCCAGVTPEKHKAALEVMKSCQINVIGE